MPRRFRLMTANLLHEHSDPSDFARVVDRFDPDVVVTQELGHAAAEVIAARYSNHALRPAPDFTGRGVATRFDADLGEIDMPARNGTSAILDVGGISVRLAGIHLLNPIDFPWWRSVSIRRRQLQGLFGWLDESAGGPIVVAGDCNASPAWPAYRRLAARLTDLVAEHADSVGRRPERTWGWRPGWPRLLRIDHVFGIGMRAGAVSVEPIRGTDHWTVIADLDLDP